MHDTAAGHVKPKRIGSTGTQTRGNSRGDYREPGREAQGSVERLPLLFHQQPAPILEPGVFLRCDLPAASGRRADGYFEPRPDGERLSVLDPAHDVDRLVAVKADVVQTVERLAVVIVQPYLVELGRASCRESV